MTHTSNWIKRGIKRSADFTVSLLLICMFAPLIVAVAFAIRIRLGSPVIFVQIRPGLNGVPFSIFKFRTMSNECDANGILLPDDRRISKLGDFLRSTSIDEIPQLVNVLMGQMSLVGPRPLLMEYLPLYTDRQKIRLKVKPGITGYAQVNGRNARDWASRLDLDSWYVENWSLLLDVKILIATVGVVFFRRGIKQPGRATVDKFKG